VKVSKAQLLSDLQTLFGTENVITEQSALQEHDSDNSAFAKSFGVFRAKLPLCILNVASTQEVTKALRYCNDNEVSVIPRTGGTSYEELLTCVNDQTVMVDASAMNKILSVDLQNMMATCQCGVPLQTLESQLNKQGYTTGHSPQSLPLAHMGGLVATRSIGQFSTYYGGIEDMVCGLEAVLPDGEVVRIRNVPRRASGPDLRHLFLGSEGGLGFVTEVTMKVYRYYPNDFWKGGYVMPDMHTGLEAVREIMTAGYRPSVVRLYDKWDYDYNFGTVKLEENEAYMFFVAEGPPTLAKATGDAIDAVAKAKGGKYIGTEAVEHWLIHRNDVNAKFRTEGLRQYYRESGVYYSTTEISAVWSEIGGIYDAVIKAVPEKIESLIAMGGHVSHSYQTGTNIYFVYQIKVKSPETFAEEHSAIIDTICNEVLKHGTGGCVHHHGMGKKRVKFAAREHGSSYALMKGLKKMMDPKGIMNPGVLIQ
jgi:FAD/FMN-containing dehydrogenase